MTRSRQYILLGALASIAVLVAGWFLLVSPAHKKVEDISAQADSQRSTNSGLQAQVSALQAIARDLPRQEAATKALAAKVPTSAELPDLLRTLRATADKSGVTLSGIAPTAPAPLTTAPGVEGVDVTLSVAGDYVALESFEVALENLPRAFLVTGFTIQSATDSGSSASSGTATGSTTATINGRVLVKDSSTSASPSGSTAPTT